MGAPPELFSQRSHHLVAAGPAVPTERLISALYATADQALKVAAYDEAEAAYRGARVLGLPAPRVEPYRAELAFLRRDFDEVREIIEHLDNWQGLSRLQPVVRLWSSKARVSRQASTTP